MQIGFDVRRTIWQPSIHTHGPMLKIQFGLFVFASAENENKKEKDNQIST